MPFADAAGARREFERSDPVRCRGFPPTRHDRAIPVASARVSTTLPERNPSTSSRAHVGALRIPLILALTIAWASSVSVCVLWISSYGTKAGAAADVPSCWPFGSSLSPVAGRGTIVMFVHPKCPCTRASLSELNVVMNAVAGRATAHIAFLSPDGVDVDWVKTGSWDAAATIPSAVRFVDRDGEEAIRFGVRTSGHVLLYDVSGRLRYSGGITATRGHAGDNMGRRAVLELLSGGSGERRGRPVYGCALHDDPPSGRSVGSERP